MLESQSGRGSINWCAKEYLYWFCIDFIERKITADSVLVVLDVLSQYVPTSRILIPVLCMFVYSNKDWHFQKYSCLSVFDLHIELTAKSEGSYTKCNILSGQSLLIQITNTATPSCLYG